MPPARLRGLIVVLWRAGLRISEALALAERDLDPGRGALLVRHGKGGKRREVGMDEWGWEQVRPWLDDRSRMPIGARSSASSTARYAGARGLARPRGLSCVVSHWMPVSGAVSRPTSSATPTPSKWLVKVFH
jgi:integrase